MTICGLCGKGYERKIGVLINVCDDCLSKPSQPDAYIKKKGLLIPNPESKK